MRPRIRAIAILCVVIATLACVSAQPVDEASRKNAFVHYSLGEELMRAERFEKAAGEFSSAIKLDPLLTAHYELGQAYMSLKRYAEAVRAYVGCREAFRQIAGLIVSNDFVMDDRREEEVRELRDSIRRFQSGEIKTTTSRDLMVAKLEERIGDLERMKQRGTANFETPAARARQRVVPERATGESRDRMEGGHQCESEARRSAQQPRGHLHADRPAERSGC